MTSPSQAELTELLARPNRFRLLLGKMTCQSLHGKAGALALSIHRDLRTKTLIAPDYGPPTRSAPSAALLKRVVSMAQGGDRPARPISLFVSSRIVPPEESSADYRTPAPIQLRLHALLDTPHPGIISGTIVRTTPGITTLTLFRRPPHSLVPASLSAELLATVPDTASPAEVLHRVGAAGIALAQIEFTQPGMEPPLALNTLEHLYE